MPFKTYIVYIITNLKRNPLYIGITGSAARRVAQHKQEMFGGFTAKYKLHRLVYWEEFTDVRAAIAREKQLKGWTRAKKIALIESVNPAWEDLSASWLRPATPPQLRMLSVEQRDREANEEYERRVAFVKRQMKEIRKKQDR